MEKIILASKKTNTVFCVDSVCRGITRVASSVAADFRSIIEAERPNNIRVAASSDPSIGAAANANTVISASVLGEGGWADKAAAEGIIDASAIEGKRECYLMKVQKRGRQTLIIIAASDRLGAEYGLYKLAELAGVSPWHYFADVYPKKRPEIELDADDLNTVSREPKIKLRGFFMNDEWPSLGPWAYNTFGGFNELFYEKVFDLLLRLRGNFLWPAMWVGVFSEDGLRFPTASAELADELGITMGTSHHEPLFRAGEEFSHLSTDSNDVGYGKDWNYHTNARGLYSFWEDSVKRNHDFKSLITIGMRGERDSKILGENATLKDNIDLLKKTITDQKKILRDAGLADAPKVLALYKEVEDYFYGDKQTEGLHSWSELDDVMFLLSDDNFGNTRTLPTEKTKNREAGWGLYYHFDYHGSPISYEWVNSTPITKAWEQLTMAYEYGIRDLWVANVGDLRPDELPLSYFLDLAFDYDIWSERNKTGEYLDKWTKQQFGGFVDEGTLRDIPVILNGYTRLNGDRRPEATYADTFSPVYEDEAHRELERSAKLDALAQRVSERIPEERKDAYYGLVGFPAMASANLREMMVLAGMHKLAQANGAAQFANELRTRVNACIDRDKELERVYNEEMSGGKWKYMMSSKHVAFINWNEEGSSYPILCEQKDSKKKRLLVSVSGCTSAISCGSAELPLFTSTENNLASVTVASTNGVPEYSITASEEWLVLKKREGFECADEYLVSADFAKLGDNASGEIVISDGSGSITLKARAQRINTESVKPGVFVESTGAVSMEAEHFTSKHDAGGTSWGVIENYGKSLSTMKVFPPNISFSDPAEAPWLEYTFIINNPGDYIATVVIAPTNNTEKNKGLRFALMLDEGAPMVIDSLPEGYMAGEPGNLLWCKNVLDNDRRCDLPLKLSEGEHKLRFCVVDAGTALQKIEIAKEKSGAYYGYRETFRK